MKPILYTADETAFDTNGIGILSDAIDCTVIEVLNNKFEMEMKYPVKGIHFKQIRQRSLILVKPDPVTEPQPFRVYRITKPMNGQVMVYARHLAYDTAGITAAPFSAGSAVSAMQGLKTNASSECPFTFYTDMGTSGEFKAEVPTPIWSLMGSDTGMILDVYGGEFRFDRYRISLLNRRGQDRGVSIRYGKNLTSLEQDENCADCYTAVHPYWKGSDDVIVQLPEKVVHAPGNFGYTQVVPLDCSQQWEDAPTEEMLRAYATEYIQDNRIGIPKTSWKIEFVQLEKSEEYKGAALLERVLLGDTVSVDYAELDVSATARVNEVRYKPILERYESVTLGDAKANLADTLVNQQRQLDKKPTKTQLQIAMEALTAAITGAKGGSVRLLDNDGDGEPDTLYIADHPDPEQATKVWRFNYEGWGASENGYNGPFTIGASLVTGIAAHFIAAGTLYGMLVKAGAIESEDGKIIIDLSGGKEPVFNTGITTNGLRIADEQTGSKLVEIDSYNTSSGHHFADMQLFSVDGTLLMRATETFYDDDPTEPVGVDLSLHGRSENSEVSIAADDKKVQARCSFVSGKASALMSSSSKESGFYLLDKNGEARATFKYSNTSDSSVLAVEDIETVKLGGREVGWLTRDGTTYLVAIT